MTREPALQQVSEHVFVQPSRFCQTNSALILGPDRTALLIDPGVRPTELAALARQLQAHAVQVVAAVVTHPHWDHTLWWVEWGAVPRWADEACARAVNDGIADLRAQAERDDLGSESGVRDGVTSLPADADHLPWDGPSVRLARHQAHAPGHLALLVDGVLLAGDMLSDIEIPLLDQRAADPIEDYRHGLEVLACLGQQARLVIPGHGHLGDTAEVTRRLAADRAYLAGLGQDRAEADPRLGPEAPAWMMDDHQAHVRLAHGEMR